MLTRKYKIIFATSTCSCCHSLVAKTHRIDAHTWYATVPLWQQNFAVCPGCFDSMSRTRFEKQQSQLSGMHHEKH